MLGKEHGRIDWSKRALAVHDHVRAMNPWPGAFTTVRGRIVKVRATRVVESATLLGVHREARAGQVTLADKKHIFVACGEGTVELTTVQPEGKRAMNASEWAMGRAVAEGDVLG
jgi:methionyl-tRNA formyltransferase